MKTCSCLRLQTGVERVVPALLAAFLLAAATPGAALAQSGVSVEPRVGVTFPLGDLSDAGAESGIEMGADVLLSFHPSFSGYLAFQRHTFACDEGCELGDSPRSTGLGAGIKFIIPSPADALMWTRGGVIAHQYQDDVVTADRSAGVELGAGIDMLIGARLFLVPRASFVYHDAGGAGTASYLTFGVGVHYHIR